jgi:phage shock protein A
MPPTDAPLKVDAQTKEQIRLAAAIIACTQGQFVQRAVAEYIERHADELSARVEQARAALLEGDEQLAAYLVGRR